MLYKLNTPDKTESDIDRLKELSPAEAKLTEKDLENIIARRIDELVRTDQLMVLMQERKRQEEPDIIAVDQDGLVYIFELKRWSAKSENLLQVLRYGQKFGRYDYVRLNDYYQSYAHNRGQTCKNLQEAHREYFDLQDPLAKGAFNNNQRFVVITNGLDYDTWDAISYWQKKGILMNALIYRVFKIGEEIFLDFDPYGPVPDAPQQAENGIFVVNTNKTYMPDAYKAMVEHKKASAYYCRKRSIENIKAGDTVCLYHVGVGIIGIGHAKTDYQSADIGQDKDEEYYVPVNFDYLVDINVRDWEKKAVPAWEINEKFSTSYRFRQTVFQLPAEFGGFIKSALKAR